MQNRYLKIIGHGLTLGASVFGGVSVAYPAIRRLAPSSFDLNESEVDGLYAFAYILPGPSFLNLWGAVCMRVAGLPGAILGEVALLLPSTLIVLLLPQLGRIGWLAAHSGGMGAGAAWATVGLTLAAGLDGIRKMKQRKDLLAAAILLVLGALGIHSMACLAVVLLLYGGAALWESRRGVSA
ncbi:MAG TPA: chromate transporter [Symbiobacteriaceae bacterium]|nr:chromate transporter [Symbiobacteriaceae bacterium]